VMVDQDDVAALPYLVEFAAQVELSGTVEWLQRWRPLALGDRRWS